MSPNECCWLFTSVRSVDSTRNGEPKDVIREIILDIEQVQFETVRWSNRYKEGYKIMQVTAAAMPS